MNRFYTILTCSIGVFAISTLSSGQIQKGLDIDGEGVNDKACVVSMPDANTIAIGAINNDDAGADAGHVRVYKWNGSVWVQKGSDINGEAAGDYFGTSVSMPDSNTVAIGAIGNDGNGTNAGHVRVYTWTGINWVQKGIDIDGEGPACESGISVSMPDPNTVAIGAIQNNSFPTDAGNVRVFEWNGSAWMQKGAEMSGEAAGDLSGRNVSMPNSNTVAIAAPYNDGNGSNAGHVRVYSWDGSAWVQKGVDLNGLAANDNFGLSLAMPDENTIAIGAPWNTNLAPSSGQVTVFGWNGSAWIQMGSGINGQAASDNLGWSVDMPSPNRIVVGAPFVGAGYAKVFSWDGTNWQQFTSTIYGEFSGDASGVSVSMPDAGTVAIGANFNSGNGWQSGQARVYTLCSNTSSTINTSSCNSYTSPSGNYTWTSSGTYNDVIENSTGCDSLITINLTINSTYTETENVISCGAYTWPANGVTYTSSTSDVANLTSVNGCDSTVNLQLIINNPTSSVQTISACDSYTWIDGNTYTSSTNTPTHIIPNSVGCDSTIALNLTITNTPIASASLTGFTLTSTNTASSYQWIDCDNGNAPISGATSQTFSPTVDGNYAVVLSNGSCDDTSNCVTVLGLGMDDNDDIEISIYPNPVSDFLVIETDIEITTIRIYSMDGSLIDAYGSVEKVSTASLLPGIYLVSVECGDRKFNHQFIKK